MLNFLKLEPESFGLDFSDLCLRLAKLERKKNFYRLVSFAQIPLKAGIIEGGIIKKEDALANAIRTLLSRTKGKKIKTNMVVASLPENKVFFQVIKMPKMGREELKTAVPFESENYIPLSIEEVYLDFQVLPSFHPDPKHIDVLISAMPRKIVDSYISAIKKSGLYPRVLEPESQAIIRALIKNQVSYSPLLIVDFGKSNTHLIFFSGYSVKLTTSLPFSSQRITDAISQNLKVKTTEAEKLKKEIGLIGKEKKNLRLSSKEKKVIKITKEVLKNLIGQIEKYIDYYQTHINSNNQGTPGQIKIKKIILCGRGSNLKGLADFLSLKLNIPTELGNPWINILPSPLKELPPLSFEESLGFTSALGLALRAVRKEYD